MRTLILALTLVFAPLGPAFAEEPPSQAELTTRAEAGDSGAMIELAILLINDDVVLARQWARRGAEAGNAEAMNVLAILLRNGEGSDLAEAQLWEDRAIAGGSQGATVNRGFRIIYEDGSEEAWARGFALIQSVDNEHAGGMIIDIALDYARSQHATPARVRELYRIAAERGSPAGQWEYAMMLRQGQGGPADVPQAYEWVRRSGEAGFIDGLISTAVMLATGEGVTENDAEARLWYERAAEQSSAHALRGLAYMLITGEGGPVDEPRGWAYMLLAAEGGDQTAINVMNQQGRYLSAETMRAASALRAAWLTTHAPPH